MLEPSASPPAPLVPVAARVSELEAMQSTTAILLAQPDPHDAAVTVARVAGELLGARRAALWWSQEGRPVSGAHWPPSQLSSLDAAGDAAPPEPSAWLVQRSALASNGTLMMPLLADGERVGVVTLERASSWPFERADVGRADRLAAIAGPVLRTARRLHDQEHLITHLRELDHVKTEFLALASHELRTPITVLTGYLSLLEDGAFGVLPAESREIMPAINARLAEMEALINGMLETARVDDGRLRLEIDSWDLREIVDEAVRRSEVFAHPSQAIGLRCPDAPVPVLVDRERVLTVVANIVHNAIKYSPGHSDVHCTVSADGATASVSICDHGLGIAAEDMDTLFTRFGRIRRDPAVRDIAGTGLGLYLSRELARAHGGDILVESSPGEGSTFTVVLPTGA